MVSEMWGESHDKVVPLLVGESHIICKAATLVQGDCSVMVYVTELQAIWTEIGHFWPIKNPESEEWGYTIKDRLNKLLMGPNIEYEALRSQILNHEKVSNIEEAINIVLEEES